MTLMVVNNLGENAQTYTVTMPNVGFPAGLTVVDVLSCRNVTVNSSGGLAAEFVAGLPMVSSFFAFSISYVGRDLLHFVRKLLLTIS